MLGAVFSGSVVYGTLGLVGGLVPGTSVELGARVGLVGLAAAFAWHVLIGTRLFAWPRRQIQRRVALNERYGMLAYGAVLGAGLLTLVSTPLVWLGALTAAATGSILVGAVYGVGFSLARAAMLAVYHADLHRPVRGRVERAQGTVARAAGGAGLVAVAVAWLAS